MKLTYLTFWQVSQTGVFAIVELWAMATGSSESTSFMHSVFFFLVTVIA